MKTWVTLLSLFVIAFCFRLLFLTIPVGISHDELDYVLNGKWFAVSGSDLTQTWQPWSLTPIQTATLTAELPAIFFGFWLMLFPLSLESVRLLPVLISSLLPVAMFLWLRGIRLDPRWAFITGLLLAINPWSLVFSHTAYEAPLALTFLIVGLAALSWMVHVQKPRAIAGLFVVASLFGSASFFSYHGFKLLVLPAFLVLAVWLWRTQPAGRLSAWHRRGLMAIVGLLAVMTALSFVNTSRTYSSRASELLPLNQEYVTEQVNLARNQSLDSPLTSIFINKATVVGWKVAQRYFTAYDLSFWFVVAEDGSTVLALWEHGYFYLFEIGLLLLGIWQVLRNRSSLGWLLLAMAAVAPIPSALQMNFSYTFRSSFLVPLLAIVIAAGIIRLSEVLTWRWAGAIVLGAYLVFGGHWLWIYQTRYPVSQAASYRFDERLLASYLKRLPSDQSTVVMTTEPYHWVRAVAFYNGTITPELAREMGPQFQAGVNAKSYTINRTTFTNTCLVATASAQTRTLVVINSLTTVCPFGDNALAPYKEGAASPVDSGTYFKVMGEVVCEGVGYSERFVRATKLTDFNVEDLSNEDFCRKWVLDIPEVEEEKETSP